MPSMKDGSEDEESSTMRRWDCRNAWLFDPLCDNRTGMGVSPDSFLNVVLSYYIVLYSPSKRDHSSPSRCHRCGCSSSMLEETVLADNRF
mmetsp:Transcript_40882/g.161937  ORF Transcript_40882/g.161937 Transcript_40882/m.161937 type:complete len:90 (-) Transcript_40882:1372-1641(-)